MAVPAVGRVINEYRVEAYGAIGDGSSHTLSSLGFTDLGVAQLTYPAATALTDEADWCAIQGAINAANAAGGGIVELGPKTYRTHAQILLKAHVSLRGVRPRTRITPVVSNTHNILRVQTGTPYNVNGYFTNSSFVEGIWLHGPSTLSYPTGSINAGLMIDGSTCVSIRDVVITNCSVGVDMINNNYNTNFYNLTIPRFGGCEYGIYLRTGPASGSDIHFHNTMVFAWRICVAIAGGCGQVSFSGFQMGNNNTSSDDGTGVINFGYDLATGTTGGTQSNICFQNGTIEGPHYNWMIRGVERFFASFRHVGFLATATDATKMLGMVKLTSASNGNLSFYNCEVKGSFANTQLTSISGASVPIINEHDWRIEYNGAAINAGGTTYSGFGSWWGLLWQAGITSGRASQYNATAYNGRWVRSSTASGVLEWSDDPTAATWKQVGIDAIKIAVTDQVTAFTAGTNKATFRMPYAFRLLSVRAELSTAQGANGDGGILTLDINEGGTSVLGTKLTIDNGEKTSTTAATAATVTDTTLADDAEITIDIDQIGDGSARGLKVTLLGYRN